MQFYIVTNSVGETAGCQLTLRAAQALGRSLFDGAYNVDRVTVGSIGSREVIRRLLGEHGGYADEQVRVIENGKRVKPEVPR